MTTLDARKVVTIKTQFPVLSLFGNVRYAISADRKCQVATGEWFDPYTGETPFMVHVHISPSFATDSTVLAHDPGWSGNALYQSNDRGHTWRAYRT